MYVRVCFTDIAIGAPYAGTGDGIKGMVYIYYGTAEPDFINTDPQQVIAFLKLSLGGGEERKGRLFEAVLIHTHTLTHTYTYMYTYTHTHTHTHTSSCTHTYVHVHTYNVHIHTHTHTHTCTYVRTYTHTHAQTITASDVVSGVESLNELTSFAYSLSSGTDIDGNGYNGKTIVTDSSVFCR